MADNTNSNTNTQATSPSQTQNSNLPKDYFELFTKHYKAIISAIIAAIPFLGVVFTFLFYVHEKSYLEYFGISENWVEVELSKSIYNLIYKGCISFIVLLPNTIALAPLLFEKETCKKVRFEFLFTLGWMSVIALISELIKSKIRLTYLKTFIMLSLLWTLILGLPVIFSLMNNFVSAITLIFTHPIKTFRYLFRHIKNIRIKTIFKNIANGIDKMNNFIPEPRQNETDEERITNRNKGLYILIIILIVFSTLSIMSVIGFGQDKAHGERNFSVIKLNESEVETYDDLKQNFYGEKPYIQSDERVVNSKVILSENDDCYLVVNAYIDKTDNGSELYLFTSEQTLIEKTDVIVNKIEVYNKAVIP